MWTSKWRLEFVCIYICKYKYIYIDVFVEKCMRNSVESNGISEKTMFIVLWAMSPFNWKIIISCPYVDWRHSNTLFSRMDMRIQFELPLLTSKRNHSFLDTTLVQVRNWRHCLLYAPSDYLEKETSTERKKNGGKRLNHRRKFRSLTSDNMQGWKSRVEMSSQQKEDQHACRVTRKKVHVRKMLGTSRIAVFFQWFVLPDVRKVASLKRRVRMYLF